MFARMWSWFKSTPPQCPTTTDLLILIKKLDLERIAERYTPLLGRSIVMNLRSDNAVQIWSMVEAANNQLGVKSTLRLKELGLPKTTTLDDYLTTPTGREVLLVTYLRDLIQGSEKLALKLESLQTTQEYAYFQIRTQLLVEDLYQFFLVISKIK